MIDGAGLAEIGQWIGTGGTIGILGLLVGFWLKKRKDDRDGWGDLIDRLTKAHDRCEERLTEVERRLDELRRLDQPGRRVR